LWVLARWSQVVRELGRARQVQADRDKVIRGDRDLGLALVRDGIWWRDRNYTHAESAVACLLYEDPERKA
jgi:hypothetical protein